MNIIRTHLLLALLFTTTVATADSSIATRYGTLGVGLEYKYLFHEKFGARAVVNYVSESGEDMRGGNEYTGAVKWTTYGLLGDWHPTGGVFRISAGVLSRSDNALNINFTGTEYGLGGTSYPDSTVNLMAEWDTLSPYLGIGWSGGTDWLRMMVDIGAMFQGDVMLTGSGNIGGCGFDVKQNGMATVGNTCTPTRDNNFRTALDNDIETEHRALVDDIDDFRIYPVISLGVQLNF